MHIKVKVGDRVVAGDFDKDLHIPDDPEELCREISRYPSLYFYWSAVAEQAKREEEVLKREYGFWEAEMLMQARSDLKESGDKITEAAVRTWFNTRYADEQREWADKLDRAAYRKNILILAAKSMLEKGSAAVNVLSYKKQQLSDASRQ